MTEEQIIRNEAKDFIEYEIDDSGEVSPISNFHKIKSRLSDFYTSENKAIFLDEIKELLNLNLQTHRDKAHEGLPDPECGLEIRNEILLFYINQELSTLPTIAHQKYKSKVEIERNKVFVSYSHLDKEYLKDIQRHFKPFNDLIDFWDDSRIQPGQKWSAEIKDAIEKTKVAIFLVSTEFLGSQFIKDKEIPPLLEAAEKDGATILILILKPCLFEEFPNLNQYQALNPPSNPIIGMSYQKKEELLVNLVRQTKKLLEQ